MTPPWTGVGRYTLELLRAFATDPGVTLGVLATPAIAAALADAGVRPEVLPARFAGHRHPWVELETAVSVRRAVRAWGPDVVWGPAFDGAAAPPGVPCVVTVHDLAYRRFPGTMPRRFAWLLGRKVRGAAARGATLLAPCLAGARDLAAAYPGAPVAYAREGVAAAMLAATDADAARVRRAAGLPEVFLLTVGGAHPRKGVGGLIEALAAWEDAPPLVVAGAPAPRETPAVLPLGHVGDGDLPGLYRAAAALVHPALYEGFGLPPLEALAAGTRVVATATGAIPEYLAPDETAEPGDYPGLVARTRAALAGPDDAAARAGRRARAEEWSWARAARDHLAVFAAARDRGTP